MPSRGVVVVEKRRPYSFRQRLPLDFFVEFAQVLSQNLAQSCEARGQHPELGLKVDSSTWYYGFAEEVGKYPNVPVTELQ